MSSAAAGGTNKISGARNKAAVTADKATGGEFAATSAVSAEAQQGHGPAAASASGSGTSAEGVDTTAVAVSCNGDFAVAACPIGVVAVGLNSASAAAQTGVVAVGPEGVAATSNAANASEVAVRAEETAGGQADAGLRGMLEVIRGELDRLADDTAELKDALGHAPAGPEGDAGARSNGARAPARRASARRGRAKTANGKRKPEA